MSDPMTPAPAACPVCTSAQTHAFYTQLDVARQGGLLWPTREAAQAAPRGDVNLVHCRACGHVFNRSFEPDANAPAGDPAPAAASADGRVALRSVLQAVSRPREFLATRRPAVLGSGGVVSAEVPGSGYVFEKLSIWNIVYETGCFYGRTSLTKLFSDCGYFVQDCFACGADDQNVGIEAGVTPGARSFAFDPAEVDRFARIIDRFAVERQHKTAYWRHTLDRLATQGRRVVLWGAGARAQAFCDTFELDDVKLPYVVDPDPGRHGRFVAKTRQTVVPPETLQADHPDVVLIAHSEHTADVQRQIGALGVRCETMVLD